MMGEVDNVIKKHNSPSQVKITIPKLTVSIINGAGYLHVKKKYITPYIQLKKKDKIKAEIIINGEKIKFIAKLYNYKHYSLIYQIPTIVIELLRRNYSFTGFRFTTNLTIIIDPENDTQKLILEVPYWETKNAFDSFSTTRGDGQ